MTAAPATRQNPQIKPLDLSQTSVHAHWDAHGVGRLIAAMESCEPWAVDAHPQYLAQAEKLLAEVVARYNAANSQNIANSVAADPALTIDFMGYLRSGRALVLFAWLSQVHPDIPSRLFDQARFGGDDFGAILVERIKTLEKSSLLSRVFSPERIALVTELLESAGFGTD